MSETTNLKLFKHDNPSTNTNQFDVDKALNQNWDKLDDFAGEVNDKVIEIEDNIDGQAEDIEITKQEFEQEINELQKDIQANSIIEETEQAKSLYIDDATDSRGKISVEGNVEQETSLYNGALEQGSLSASGTDVDASNRIRTADYIEVKENTEIKVLADGANQYLLAFFSTSKEYMSGSDWTNLGTGITIIASAKYAKVILRKTDNSTINVADISNFVVGDTPSIYYPSKIIALGSNKNELHMQEKEYTAVGINVTQKESSLQLNGTTTSAANLLSGNFVDIGRFKKGKHILSITEKGSFERSGSSDFSFSIKEKNNTSNVCANITGANLQGGKSSFAFELDEEKDLVIQMFANASNIVFDNFEMLLKIEEGETATSYSPYRTR